MAELYKAVVKADYSKVEKILKIEKKIEADRNIKHKAKGVDVNFRFVVLCVISFKLYAIQLNLSSCYIFI